MPNDSWEHAGPNYKLGYDRELTEVAGNEEEDGALLKNPRARSPRQTEIKSYRGLT